jgi:hypothetical protein
MKRFIIVCSALVMVIAGAWSYIWWQSPAETKEFTSADQNTHGVLGSNMVLTPWRTLYFSTSHPDTLRVITSNEVAQGLTLGQYLLGSASLTNTDQLAVTVGNLDGLTLDELPAVKLRQQRSDIYRPATVSFALPGVLGFSAKNGYEMAIFWQHEAKYAAVVASGSSARQAELAQALESVVENWQWQL